MENSRTVIKEHPGIRQNYHNMPDGAGLRRVCVRSRNGDHIRLTYTNRWVPVHATVNHEGRLSTTGYLQDHAYFEDLERQIAEGLKAADLITAEKEKEQQADRAALTMERAAQQKERADKLAEKAAAKKKSRGQSTFEAFAVQHVEAV